MTMLNDSTVLTLNFSTLDSEFTGNKTAQDGFLIENIPYSPEKTLYASLEKDFGAYRVRLDHTRIDEHPSFPYNSKKISEQFLRILIQTQKLIFLY